MTVFHGVHITRILSNAQRGSETRRLSTGLAGDGAQKRTGYSLYIRKALDPRPSNDLGEKMEEE